MEHTDGHIGSVFLRSKLSFFFNNYELLGNGEKHRERRDRDNKHTKSRIGRRMG